MVRLRKALYRLKQSPRLFINAITLVYRDDLQISFNSRKRPARRFLGMSIDTTRSGSGFFLYQTSYIKSLPRRFNMTDSEHLATVGSLMYAALGIRTGINYAIPQEDERLETSPYRACKRSCIFTHERGRVYSIYEREVAKRSDYVKFC